MGGLLAAGQPDYAVGCAWKFGWAGWAELCLGGSLDGQGLSHTHLGWAEPEASRRHVRHARGTGSETVPKGLGLSPDTSRRSRPGQPD